MAAVQTSPAINVGTTATYQFTGHCSDCTGTGTGSLTVQNYTLGQPLGNGNFVSFSYSSNLTSFTISSATLVNLGGTLPASLPGPAAVTIIGPNNVALNTQLNGNWCSGTNCLLDSGSGGSWGLPGSTVPALSIPAMIGLAVMMVLMGAFLLKRLPNRNAA